MRFKRSVQRYGRTPEPETPYQRAGQSWDDRIGSARVQARNWRLMAFGGLLLTTGMSAALVWQSLQSKVVPYVVAIDRLGEARAVSEAERDYQPSDTQIAWHLGRFITNVRARSLDAVLMRENWLSAYDFATERGALFLGEYARSANPFAEIGRRTVAVQINSVVRASDSSFRINWTEQAYERGSLIGTSRWTAVATIKIQTPRSADVLRKNPLGIYVDAIDWSRELDTLAPRSAVQSLPPQSAPSGQAGDSSPPTGLPLGSPLERDPGETSAPDAVLQGDAQ